jgi:subtilase family serine protease
VDNPASDTAITAAGGTTLPGFQAYKIPGSVAPLYIDVPEERAWGWDYLSPLCSALELDLIDCGIYDVGTGGGVSIIFPKPQYQWYLGAQSTQPGQYWYLEGQLVLILPAYFSGRNVPDISFNADPQTGYLVYYTSDVTGFSVQSGWGGTSFVAPQLNGVTALLGQYTGIRIGLLNVPLYDLAHAGAAYDGVAPPIRAVPYGDNWFYHGLPGYNRTVGLGTLDVANFAEIINGLR